MTAASRILTDHRDTRARFPRDYALAHAEAIVDALVPYCDRIEIAGSIRRGRRDPKDIEIVAQPKRMAHANLLGEPEVTFGDLNEGIRAYCARERHPLTLRRVNPCASQPDGYHLDGPRFKALQVGADSIPVDLFIVLPPAQWGSIFFIRTGPHDWNVRAIARATKLGLRHIGGHLERDGKPLDTPEEIDVFRALRSPWVEPEDRK